jgi:hypothetical protein
MAFAGDLTTIILTDILSWVASRRKTGTLELKRRSTQKRLLFRAGRLQSSWSNDPRETLGQALIRERLLDEQQLFEALLTHEKTGQRLGRCWSGTVSEPQLLRVLRWKAEEIVYDCFLWPEGQFDFQDGEGDGCGRRQPRHGHGPRDPRGGTAWRSGRRSARSFPRRP